MTEITLEVNDGENTKTEEIETEKFSETPKSTPPVTVINTATNVEVFIELQKNISELEARQNEALERIFVIELQLSSLTLVANEISEIIEEVEESENEEITSVDEIIPPESEPEPEPEKNKGKEEREEEEDQVTTYRRKLWRGA